MVKSTGQGTVVIAQTGSGGAGGSRGGGGSSGSSNGDSKPKSGGVGKFKLDDKTFWSIATVLGLVGGAAYIYSTRPDLVNEFVGTITGNKAAQVPSVPAQPTGTVQNDTLPQQTTGFEQQGMQDPFGQMSQYPYGPGMGGSQAQFQFPQQQSPNLQQYQPYQPTDYGGMGMGNEQQMTTSWNPQFGQNSNQPTYSFAARRITKLDYDSQDGMLRPV